MDTKNNAQIQIRIDAKTKNEVKKVFDSLGLDISSAVKLFFRQAINAKNFPCELRDENGMTLANAIILREASLEGRKSKKIFGDGASLIKDALKD
ncbi:MAG: type II toxin-antitoxin system RelB/DinJ family antitoxin [bacterium]